MEYAFWPLLIVVIVAIKFFFRDSEAQDQWPAEQESHLLNEDEITAFEPSSLSDSTDDSIALITDEEDFLPVSTTARMFASETSLNDSPDVTVTSLDIEPSINPASGLPMLSEGGIDIAGNPFGFDLSSSIHDDSFDTSLSGSSLFDDDVHSSINHSAFDDSMSTGLDDDLFQDDLHDPFNSDFDDW
ncbi:MAG: hypothetical protein LAT77_02605 [Aliidiomarina sp.]|uniref:hypothetical protein n=1 Tax=Aliidiomarina sp. TaxID=1872439 RepID=UPI0025C33307|nr:hypothetical protein [Aliidiomarina sp.]MCH8500783.1 hypothetical protein [Aliidiomarina sp.]